MGQLKLTLPFLLLLLCFSCKNSNIEGGGSLNDIGNNSMGGDSLNSTVTPPEEQYIPPPPPSKEIEWADGNTYTYEYKEVIETKDSIGNVAEVYTIYKRNQPVNVNCETKECRWCRKEIYAENYSIEEFPNVNALKDKTNYFALYKFFAAIATSPSYFDLENKKIRTEWRVNCDYGSLDDFCSMKCQSEYNRR